jgi:hypothetical protein
MVTAAARPPIFWVGNDQERVRGWPIGPALLATLGDINGDVHDALADERARLTRQGYAADFPLPALWWNGTPCAEPAAEKLRLAAIPA